MLLTYLLTVLFLAVQVNRPMTMRKDGIQTRKRRPKTTAKLPLISLKPDQHDHSTIRYGSVL